MINEPTLDEIIQKINKNDKEYFYDIYNESWNINWAKIAYDMNYGDGNDYYITLSFPKYEIYVNLVGTYSSYDSPYWDKVSFAVPFEYTETRYKDTTLSEIRNEKIDNVLGQEQKP